MAGPGRLSELAEAVRSAAGPHLPDGPRVVALSGGPDSAVCAWLAGESGAVRAVHVHHGWPYSDLMAEAARAVAAHLGVSLETLPIETGEGPSPEGRARRARYRALEGTLDASEWLLTGHTADDQAETVLGNLLRGAGAEGLSGIPRRRGPIVRPLLDVWGAETRELATLLGIPWRDDPANLDPEPRRNAIRRELLPRLETQFNPALRRILVRTAALLAADHRHLEETSAWVRPRPVEGGVVLAASLLTTLGEALAARVVRRAVRELRGPHAPALGEVELVLAVARGEATGGTLAGSLRVEREGPWVLLRTDPAASSPEPVDLPFPGEARFGSWRLEAWVEHLPPLAWPLGGWRAVFDADRLGEAGRLRSAADGGRIALPGGHKAIAEALSEAAVPPRLRAGWPVLEAEGDPLWIPGVRTAPWGWVDGGTSRYLWVSVEEAPL